MNETPNSNTSNPMATGNIPKLLAPLAIPAVIAQIINLLYNIVDRIYIGHIPNIGAAAFCRHFYLEQRTGGIFHLGTPYLYGRNLLHRFLLEQSVRCFSGRTGKRYPCRGCYHDHLFYII